MYQELPIDKNISEFVKAELGKHLQKVKEHTDASDYEIFLALKNLVSEHENFMAVRVHSAALTQALNNIGK